MAASKSLTFELFGKDKTASKTMDKVGKSAEGAGKNFRKFGAYAAVGLAAVGAAAVAFGVDSVKAYADAEASQAKLAYAFKKFPALADTNQKELQNLNTELQKKTRYDDDALASAQANLAQYGLTGDQLKKLTPLLTDYAARTGKDVVTASGDLGKALLGQGRALKNVGIDFEDTGTLAGNFDGLIDGLGDKVSGFAETDVETASGKLENMRNRFGEIQEKVGEFLIPILDDLSGKIQDKVLPAIEAFLGATTDEAKQAEIDSFMATLGDKLALGAAQWGVKLNLGAQQWHEKLALGLEQWGAKLKNGWSQISTWFVNGVNEWGVKLGNGLNQITGWWNRSVAQWSGALSNGWNQISGFFSRINAGITSWVAGLVGDAYNAGTSIVRGIARGIGSAIGSVRSAIDDVMSTIASFLPQSPADQGPFSGAGWTALKTSGQKIVGQFASGMVPGAVASAMSDAISIPAVSAPGFSTATVSNSRSAGMNLAGTRLTLEIGGQKIEGVIRAEASAATVAADKANARVGAQQFAGI